MDAPRVDLLSAAAKALHPDDHAALAPDAIHDGGGWISRESAIALACHLLSAAGEEAAAAVRTAARAEGWREGFAAGWKACLTQTRFAGSGLFRALGRWLDWAWLRRGGPSGPARGLG
jgi:hypothetical protein